MKQSFIAQSLRVALAVTVVSVFFFTHSSTAQDRATLTIGGERPLSDVAMRGVDGREATLAGTAGEAGLVVAFWSVTCPWVERYEDRFIDLSRNFRERGFGFIAINPNNPAAFPGDRLEAMQQQASAKRYPFPYVVDEGSRVARAFGATRTPHVFVFDRNGILVYSGGLDDSPADVARVEAHYLRDAIEAVAGGRSIRTATTQPFGCTIKFPDN